jgi:hypothetical protein
MCGVNVVGRLPYANDLGLSAHIHKIIPANNTLISREIIN